MKKGKMKLFNRDFGRIVNGKKTWRFESVRMFLKSKGL